MIQATVNGPFGKDLHPALPVTTTELAADVTACVRAGVRDFHIHARDPQGRETLDSLVVNNMAATARGQLDVAIGITTGAWIEPDLGRRLHMISQWRGVDYATVNISEAGFEDVMRVMLDVGIGIDAGVFSVEDAELLARSGMMPHLLRVSLEPSPTAEEALAVVEQIHQTLNAGGSSAARLQHGDGESTWILVEDAFRRGLSTRVGFEDSILLPDGRTAADNAELVTAAVQLQQKVVGSP